MQRIIIFIIKLQNSLRRLKDYRENNHLNSLELLLHAILLLFGTIIYIIKKETLILLETIDNMSFKRLITVILFALTAFNIVYALILMIQIYF